MSYEKETKSGFKWLNHSQANPLNIVRNAWHIKASDIQYSDIWVLKDVVCLIESELPLNPFNMGSQKLVGRGSSWIL